jgi:hypothetical protein
MADSEESRDARQFVTTRWTIVLTAGRTDTTQAQAALEKLCQTYWYPLYAYVRRQGHLPEDAQDLVQEFFTKLIAKNYVRDVDRSKGKFRSFLLASLKHFLANERDKSRAEKRGGGQTIVSLDAETRYRLEPADVISADKIFERRWALPSASPFVLGHHGRHVGWYWTGDQFLRKEAVTIVVTSEARSQILSQDGTCWRLPSLKRSILNPQSRN